VPPSTHPAELLATDDVLTRSFDPYAFIRNAYLQRRQFQVKDGAVPSDEVEIFEDEPPPAQ
jgi:phospholipid-binding lipoprotein MlaA